MVIRMKVGKLPETVLKRSVLNQIKHRRDEVLVRPKIGEDCSVIELKEDEVFVLSTDPITGTVNDLASLAVNVTANDIASNGAEVVGIMLTLLLPQQTSEMEIKHFMAEIDEECKKLNIEVLGGHTEITNAVTRPIVSVTGVGKTKKKDLVITAAAKPGEEIVMTKCAGLEGTAIIAKEKEEELRTRYQKTFIESAKDMISELSVVKEAMIAKQVGVTCMHDVTEGGIYGALWEIGAASNVGIEVDLKKIILRQETVEICEFFDINPYMLMSSGCMLMVTNQANRLVEELKKQQIPSAVIGRITDNLDRVIINEDERRFLEPPKADELYKVL